MGSYSNKIVIADTQFLVVETLRNILTENGRFEAVQIVDSRFELTKVLEQSGCDLIITDPALFDYENMDDLKCVRQKFPHLPILILTNSVEKAEFSDLSKLGIKNIIYKTADRSEILAAVDAALKGKKYFSDEILDVILELNEAKSEKEKPAHLTSSEIEIVRMISVGQTTKEIANQKNISFHTVNTHRKNIFKKMGVTNASELIMQAIKAGWIDNIEYYI